MRRILAAVVMAVLVHGLFAFAVGSMAWSLAFGMQTGFGGGAPLPWLAWNGLLIAQFPLLHSWLLSARGRKLLVRLSPVGYGRTLAPTTYVVLGSLQLLAAFWLWQPSTVVWHAPHGAVGVLQWALFAAAWLFLVKALQDAGLALQSGLAGWWALLRNRPVDYGTMPTRGLFAACRQPIYLGFALVLATAPTWSPDWLLLAGGWITYCVVGPRLKEARWESMFGDRFREYRRRVPYFLPLPKKKVLS